MDNYYWVSNNDPDDDHTVAINLAKVVIEHWEKAVYNGHCKGWESECIFCGINEFHDSDHEDDCPVNTAYEFLKSFGYEVSKEWSD